MKEQVRPSFHTFVASGDVDAIQKWHLCLLKSPENFLLSPQQYEALVCNWLNRVYTEY